MGSSKIEQILDEFNDYIDECKPALMSKTNIVVSKDQLQDFLDQLRVSTPEEIKRYQKIISNRDTIIKDAETKAAAIIKAAEEKAAAMVSENDIFQRACAKANEMVADAGVRSDTMLTDAQNEANRMLYEANRDSDNIRKGALGYANEMLGEIESAISTAYESINAKSAMLVNTIKANLDTIVGNRLELNGEMAPPQQLESVPESDFMQDAEDTDYASVEDEIVNFDDSMFLQDSEIPDDEE